MVINYCRSILTNLHGIGFLHVANLTIIDRLWNSYGALRCTNFGNSHKKMPEKRIFRAAMFIETVSIHCSDSFSAMR